MGDVMIVSIMVNAANTVYNLALKKLLFVICSLIFHSLTATKVPISVLKRSIWEMHSIPTQDKNDEANSHLKLLPYCLGTCIKRYSVSINVSVVLGL